MPSQSIQERTSPSSSKSQEPFQHPHQQKHFLNPASTQTSSTTAPHNKSTFPKILITGSLSSDKNATPLSNLLLDHQTGQSQADQHNAQDCRPSTPKLRIAVIGSGLAGLTAAHLLSSLHTDNGRGETGIDVHLFEKAHKLGMDAASLSAPCPCVECALSSGRNDGDPAHEHVDGRMDVPMSSFFPEYYPTLTRLYRSIKVKFHDADNTLSCFDVDIDASSDSSSRSTGQNKCDQSSARVQEPYLSSRSYRVNSGQTITLPDLPPFSLLNPLPFGRRLMRYYRIAKDYARMLVVSKDFLAKGRMMDIGKHPIEWGNGRLITLREFLEAGGYSHDFSDFFVPLFASVCTCSFERMMEYPACAVLEYVARCMPFGRMQFISSGVQELAEKLSKNIGTIHYNTAIEEILRVGTDAQDDSEGPLVLIDSYGTRRSFDHVIFATQANQAAETLAGLRQEQPLPNPFLSSCEPGYDRDVYGENEEHDSTDPETPRDLSMESIKTTHTFYKQIRILLKFPYERTRVVCHTDTTFLPKNPAHWRLFNIAKSSSADVLASPLAKISKELEPEMIQRSKKAQAPRSSIFSLRSPSSLSKTKLVHRKTSQSRLRTHFGPSSLEPPTSSMASHSHNSAMTTHIMNNTALNLGSTTKYLQTTNPIFLPRPDTVIASAWFERAAMNPTSMKAVDELHLLMEQQTERWVSRGGIKTKEQVPDQGQNLRQNQEHDHENEQRQTPSLSEASASDRVWFVGSYAYSGIPLLEGCVVSAVQAVERIIAAEQSLQLAASVTASQESFLKRDEPMRERRRKRREEGRQDSRGNSARATTSSVYFQTAWRDVLEDERSESGKEQSPELVSRVAGARQWSVYAELAWMLLLYVAAIAKWASVIAVESLGGDGSRWAFV